MAAYAKGTRVDAVRTKWEIESMLAKRGAKATGMAQLDGRAVVFFDLADRRVQFTMPLPTPAEVAKRARRSQAGPARAYEQAVRERWRALALAIKAKFVAIDSGVETFEQAFLAHLVIPGSAGETVGHRVLPSLGEAYRDPGYKLPPLLPGGEP